MFDSHDHDRYHGMFDIENPPAEAVFIWSVGSETVLIACRAVAGLRDRRLRGAEYFSSMLQLVQEIDDYYEYNSRADYELRCTVNISKGCTAPLSPDVGDYQGGTTRLMPLRRGQFLLLFRCCRVCEDLAGHLVDTNFRISVMEARANLASGPRIQPSPHVPPTA